MSILGFDYGTKPIVLIIGDTEFPGLLIRGNFAAVGYDVVEYFGLLVNAPRLTMVFQDVGTARECFLRFKEWGGPSEDGDAVRISFVELDEGGYAMCTSQDVDRLIKNRMPEWFRGEVETRAMAMGSIKTFPEVSDSYRWFKSVTETSPFILAPAGINTPPIRDLALRKREVHFYREGELPEHSIESSLVRHRNDLKESDTRREIPSELRANAADIRVRRGAQLSRFFPVTLERLSMSKDFADVKRQLMADGFREWQVVQAACNISLKQIAPELFISSPQLSNEEQGEPSAMRVLDFLLSGHEIVARMLPPAGHLSAEKLREQIQADAQELLQYVAGARIEKVEPSRLQAELADRGLLDG